MKKPTALITLVLCIFLLSFPAQADGAALNSDSSPINSLAVYNGEVYCMTRSQFAEYSRVYRVTGGQAEEIYSDFAIDDIYSFSGGIVLSRSPERLDTLFNKMAGGNQYIEVLDPQTGDVVQWDYYPSESWPNHFVFTGGDDLFVRVITNRSDTDVSDCQYILKQYDAPGQSRTIIETEHTGIEYPTFHPVSIQKGVFFKNKIKLTLYDYETGAQYSTKSYLKLPDEYINYGTLQAVLKDEKLWYLSKDSLRVYDFSDDSDTEFLSFSDPDVSYNGFILSDEHLVFFGSNSHLIDVYDRPTRSHSSRFTSSVATIDCLLKDDLLYLYTPYIYLLDTLSGSHEIECINLSTGSQSVIPLK